MRSNDPVIANCLFFSGKPSRAKECECLIRLEQFNAQPERLPTTITGDILTSVTHYEEVRVRVQVAYPC